MNPDELQKLLDQITVSTTGGALELIKAQIEIEKLRQLHLINARLESFGNQFHNILANGLDVNNHH